MIEDLSATLMSLTKRSTRSNPWSVFQIVTDMRNQFVSFICPAPFSQTLTFSIIPKKMIYKIASFAIMHSIVHNPFHP